LDTYPQKISNIHFSETSS